MVILPVKTILTLSMYALAITVNTAVVLQPFYYNSMAATPRDKYMLEVYDFVMSVMQRDAAARKPLEKTFAFFA